MTAAQKFPLKGAAVAGKSAQGQVLLGEDWVSPDVLSDSVLREVRGRRGLLSLTSHPWRARSSPLTFWLW